MRSRIEVDKDKIPYQFQIVLGGVRFQMEFQYNETDERFTCTLYDTDGGVIVYNEPLVYGNPLFSPFMHGRVYPPMDIIPLDESGQESNITWDNFGNTVFLTLDDEGDTDDEEEEA